MIKKNKDGKKYYYYYKKKRGRHKKRGVKAKKKVDNKKKKVDRSWNYKILKFDFKKQTEYIGAYRTLEDAYKKRAELEAKNAAVEFPSKYIVSKRFGNVPTEIISEYAILKKIKDAGDSNESMLRNQYGKIVKHITTSKNYFILEKFPCLTEETFWVYGFNPKTDRKTFPWIYENLIDNEYNERICIINVYLYNNKVIFRYDGGDTNFVICKNVSDAMRMYKLLYEKYKKNKMVVFTGGCNGYSDRGKDIINLIKEKTGWPPYKIYRRETCK